MNDFDNENNGFTPEEPKAPEEKPQEPTYSDYSHYGAYSDRQGTDYSRYNDSAQQPQYQQSEPTYSPYSSQQPSQNPQTDEEIPDFDIDVDFDLDDDIVGKKKPSKGFKAFLIALIAVILCVAIVLAVYPKITKGDAEDSTKKSADSTQITLNESPKSSTKESLTAQKIAEQAKEFNVGILLYSSSQQFMSSQTSSLAGEGSGIIMSEDSTGQYTYILTCAHVISSSDSSKYDITVQDYENNTYEATVVGYDEKTDIGLLKIKASGLTCAEFGDSSVLEIGQTVYAIGNPGGTEFFGSFTNGIISSIDRPISSESGYEMECIQHTTPINSGNSGGALMNEYGQVIGINSSKIVSTGYEGMAFSIPITDAKPIIDDIIANGYVTNRPKLGIKYAAASQYQQYALILKLKDLPAGSLVIAKITDDSSLAKTDAKVGDLITEVNGEKLDSADVLLEKIENGKVGDKLELTLCRINDDYSIKEFKVTATLVEDTGSSSEEDEEEQTTQNYWEEYFKQFGGY